MTKKNKPWFVMDIDDVLCDCSNPVREMYNQAHGTNIPPATSYSTIAAWPEIGEEGQSWFYHHYTHGPTMGNLPVLAGAQEMVKKISKDFRIAYCTHRPDSIAKETIAWLEAYGFPKGNVYFNSGSKVKFRKEHSGPMAVIDDNAQYLNQIQEATNDPTLLFCVTMPHNENEFLVQEAIRTNNYVEIPIIAKRWKENLIDS